MSYKYKYETDLVIPVRNALPYVVRCVDSVFKHTKNFKLILVDDNSEATTSKYLECLQVAHPEIILVRTGFQKWFTRASNLGLRLVQSKFACLLNSDCVVHPGWLSELHEVWEEIKQNGQTPGMIGSVTSHEETRRWCITKEPDYVTGHCLFFEVDFLRQHASLMGRSGEILDNRVIDQVHINSERILCYELNRRGFTTAVAYKSWVDHEAGKSWGHDLFALFNAVKDINDLD